MKFVNEIVREEFSISVIGLSEKIEKAMSSGLKISTEIQF